MMHGWFVLFFFMGSAVYAAPYPNRPVQRGSSYQVSIGDLRHEVDNHEAEIRMFEERINTQEIIVDSLRQQLMESNHKNQELVKGASVGVEGKVTQFDSVISGITDDLHNLQEHSNESSRIISKYKINLEGLEKRMDQLQSTLALVLDALEVEGTNTVYEVKSGDSLDKIARNSKTTVKRLKDLNQLSSDRIYTGQKLKLP